MSSGSANSNARGRRSWTLLLGWVREKALPARHAELKATDLGDAGAGLIADPVACPGTVSCKMGITSPQGVGAAITEAVASWGIDDPLVQQIHIKSSGCPNGCGQHHLAAIGLQGSSFTATGATIPCFDIFLGGGGYVGGAKYGVRVARVPSKKTPQAIRKIIQRYQDERTEGEEFVAFVDRVGPKSFDSLLDECKEVGAIHEEIDTYMDWGKDELFQVIRGEGECAV